MSPVFAKAPCCLELFGCSCGRLSQHGVGEVLIPLRHCWRDAFSVFVLAVDRLSRLGVALLSFVFWSLDALFVFGLPPFAPQTPNAATLRVGLCMSPGVQYHPVKE